MAQRSMYNSFKETANWNIVEFWFFWAPIPSKGAISLSFFSPTFCTRNFGWRELVFSPPPPLLSSQYCSGHDIPARGLISIFPLTKQIYILRVSVFYSKLFLRGNLALRSSEASFISIWQSRMHAGLWWRRTVIHPHKPTSVRVVRPCLRIWGVEISAEFKKNRTWCPKHSTDFCAVRKYLVIDQWPKKSTVFATTRNNKNDRKNEMAPELPQ